MTSAAAPKGDVPKSALSSNLVRLRKRGAAAAEAVEGLDPSRAAEVERVEARNGSWSISHHGTLLASAYDPEAEARSVAEGMSEEPVDLLVAVGLGLGLHLEAFQARHGCKVIVYEPSVERLQAALEVRSPLSLLECEDVAVTTDPEEVREWVHRHYVPGLRLLIHPLAAVARLDPGSLREVVQIVGLAKDIGDLRARTQHAMAHQWAALVAHNAPSIVDMPSIASKAGCLFGRPAVVCAAGPSLDKQLPTLRRHRDSLFVIAIGQTLAALRKAGIEPDLVHVVEASDVRVQLERAGDLSGATLVLPPQANPALFELPVGRRFLSWQASNSFGYWMARGLGEEALLGAGGTVAHSAVHLAAFLGANPILLIGQDLAFTGGRIYSGSSCYGGVSLEIKESGEYELGNMKHKWGESYASDVHRGRVVWVEGWNGERLASDESYASFRESYRWIHESLTHTGQELWNCTEGGALIPPLRHVPFEEALEELASEPLDRSAFEEPVDHDPQAARRRLAAAMKRARKTHRHLLEVAREGAEKATEALALAERDAPPKQLDGALRSLGKQQRKARRLLRSGPLIEAFIQPELMQLGADALKAANQDPTPAEVAQESKHLFEATKRALRSAEVLFGQVETRLSESS